MEKSQLGGIILVLIVAAIAILFVTKNYILSKPGIDSTACKTSVDLRTSALAKAANTQLNCKTESIEIKNSNVQDIQEKIANSLYDCWRTFGKKDFFSDTSWFKPNWGFAEDKQMACMVCATIIFDESVKEKNLDIDMGRYLSETKIPDIDNPTATKTYADYFGDTTGKTMTPGSFVLKSNQDYVIIFSSAKSNSFIGKAVHGAIYGYKVGGVQVTPITIYSYIEGAKETYEKINSLFDKNIANEPPSKEYFSNVYCSGGEKCDTMRMSSLDAGSYASCPSIQSMP